MKLNCPVCSRMLRAIPQYSTTVFATRKCRYCKSRWDIGVPSYNKILTHIVRIELFPSPNVGLQTPERTSKG